MYGFVYYTATPTTNLPQGNFDCDARATQGQRGGRGVPFSYWIRSVDSG
jgi:hypothetical protein